MTGSIHRIALALLCVAFPALAQAQTPKVSAIYTLAPIGIGSPSVELGFEIEGSAAQVAVRAIGQSAAAGKFISLERAVVDRDDAGAVAFHLLVPFDAAFPADGVLQVTAEALSPDGTPTEAKVQVFDARSAPPAFGAQPIQVRSSSGAHELSNRALLLGHARVGRALAARRVLLRPALGAGKPRRGRGAGLRPGAPADRAADAHHAWQDCLRGADADRADSSGRGGDRRRRAHRRVRQNGARLDRRVHRRRGLRLGARAVRAALSAVALRGLWPAREPAGEGALRDRRRGEPERKRAGRDLPLRGRERRRGHPRWPGGGALEWRDRDRDRLRRLHHPGSRDRRLHRRARRARDRPGGADHRAGGAVASVAARRGAHQRPARRPHARRDRHPVDLRGP